MLSALQITRHDCEKKLAPFPASIQEMIASVDVKFPALATITIRIEKSRSSLHRQGEEKGILLTWKWKPVLEEIGTAALIVC